MIGRKSIFVGIKYSTNGVDYSILIQANKNLGICDIYITSNQPSENLKSIRQEVLNQFQGRPIHNKYIIEKAFNSVKLLLNSASYEI